MVRSLIALAMVLGVVASSSGCVPNGVDVRTGQLVYGGTIIEEPVQKEETIQVSTAYASMPEKVKHGAFDKRGAREALARIDVSKCGSSKDGHAKVSFTNDGTVAKVVVDVPDDLPPPARECVREAFSTARISAFDGQPVTLGTSWRGSR